MQSIIAGLNRFGPVPQRTKPVTDTLCYAVAHNDKLRMNDN